MVALSPHYVSLDHNRGAQMVKNREKERDRDETSTADATPNVTTRVPKHQAATTSTKFQARQLNTFSGPPGPLPSVYGTILTGGRI
jgi:hypothetical protein